MIDTCEPKIASWTPDGEMFVVKDPDLFASTIIPQYFDHNKFSSFARQLNFYGFRKMQAKPIRNSDFDVDTAKHVTFYNEKFKRGRCDLLKDIQRSTRGGGANTSLDQAREVAELKHKVSTLESQITEMNQTMDDRIRRLELDMLSRMEQMMLAIQTHQQTQLQLQHQVANNNESKSGCTGETAAWDPLPLERALERAKSLNASINLNANMIANQKVSISDGGATLPPHPKQKQFPSVLPPGGVSSLGVPPSRLASLRGLSRGVSRGISEQSNGSAILLRNSWEEKFFSMLMLGENEQTAAAAVAAAQQSQQARGGAINIATETARLMKENQNAGRVRQLSQGSERTLSSVSDAEDMD